MSEAKFTKGPWWSSKPKGEHRSFVMADCVRIATVPYNSGRTNTKANADLIAAAPDLYEALSDIVSNMFQPTYEQIERANDALAKARGEK